ncbi:5'/3'-nucleotidase SurE [Spirochaeta thermophila]|uniref:5'-nucleotidase SurE n=1 Tax=Winmispira thermophila (strain ATCC 49972 / DSM 6192 / RI 19.B1) TaxID=665571 RepID=E0RTH5_WINT6|nr:5'/3'-nucleotidase SurE [Spirochaeta thermophila]ADN02206.1 5'-nucleotidase SurE [Spirochaeta thermophila DSM 6192]
MRVLLTNDDGIESPGLWALHEALKDRYEVVVMAPEQEMSGTSQTITLRTPIRVRERAPGIYTCGGFPADCVVVACMSPETRPDVVVSGINPGPNLGTDILYSGTAAAARQAALMDLPALAVSLADAPPYAFEPLALYIREALERLVDAWEPDLFFNINAPNLQSRSPRVVVTRPARRVYSDSVQRFEGLDGSRYFIVYGTAVHVSEAPGCGFEEDMPLDCSVVDEGGISISPVLVHPVCHRSLMSLQARLGE